MHEPSIIKGYRPSHVGLRKWASGPPHDEQPPPRVDLDDTSDGTLSDADLTGALRRAGILALSALPPEAQKFHLRRVLPDCDDLDAAIQAFPRLKPNLLRW